MQYGQIRTMGRRGALGAALVLTGLVAAACGATADTGATTGTSGGMSSSPPAARGYGAGSGAQAAGADTVRLGTTSLGTILTDSGGRTLYLFEKDTGTASTCYGACAQAWPPVTTTGPTRTASGAMADLLGSTARTDGATQLTYAGHPLYYFSGESTPGSVKGQGLKNFGGGWYVVDSSGMKIDSD
jgi:predicted lipoprotein with Yx(FWY)xxD motif